MPAKHSSSKESNNDQPTRQTALLKAFFCTIKHYGGNVKSLFGGVQDPRNQNLITYPMIDLLFTGTFMFFCCLGSRRGIQAKLRDNGPSQDKYGALFGVEMIPHGDTLNYGFRHVNVDEVQEIDCSLVEDLIRMKVLYPYRLLGVYYLVAIDGTGVITYHQRHCKHCLKKKLSNGETLYYHPVLEAKLVASNGFAFSMMTEFIENADLSGDKQDCELKAFYRLSRRLKERFPRLPMCLLLDGLFAGGPTFKIAKEYNWKYLIVLREADLVNLHRSYNVVLPNLPENYKKVCKGKKGQIVQEFHWAEDLVYTDSQNCQYSLNVIEFLERQPDSHGQIQTLHYKWITNFTVTSYNIDGLANQGARLRWKIENEGFNVQKNNGLNLEHVYSEDPNSSKVFYLLMQLAYSLYQLMEKGNLLRDAFPKGWDAAKNLAFLMLEAWRNLVISADELLHLSDGKFQIRFNTS